MNGFPVRHAYFVLDALARLKNLTLATDEIWSHVVSTVASVPTLSEAVIGSIDNIPYSDCFLVPSTRQVRVLEAAMCPLTSVHTWLTRAQTFMERDSPVAFFDYAIQAAEYHLDAASQRAGDLTKAASELKRLVQVYQTDSASSITKPKVKYRRDPPAPLKLHSYHQKKFVDMVYTPFSAKLQSLERVFLAEQDYEREQAKISQRRLRGKSRVER
ncbi:hypothetical protein LTR66_008024, partial [Elasticomyces elasticus]